ncbi:transcription-repair coupling factor [Olsenella uli DSM 7084]|uniref:Transcription-repair-coupling factor n=1 Tax=Olsenella uli (strain ATCC 49627 / DSM 7084 / CCUG 31166 / CIP 109912 / JCM 12494 / LMG 11480 / NCIMB 702895 / VPI D76D-27C) TaxID=633147 RepID=E1QXD9_OLSUV|nr:transcription-repair coupling factor [Olsenella uli]ADK68792.1 transcription-repair coupling factor [Olsenella uli DSM 7084]KRO12274.1 transcription-repair coupling factor [Olsenella uli DSM 7084]
MFINRVSQKLLSAPELAPLLADLRAGDDATLGIAQSARPLLLAALWADHPRPCLLVVSGEEAADRAARTLAAWLGAGVVCRYPERRDWPWADKAPDDAVVGTRCNAIARLSAGEDCLVVASARSLLRRVPPVGSGYFASSAFAVGDEVAFEEAASLLVGMGYVDAGDAGGVSVPGTFHVHGDAVDVYPAQASAPVRVEFFGDEVDRVRRMLPSTGQTIGELAEVVVTPCREIALSDHTVALARRALYSRAQESAKVAAELELIERRAADPTLDKYLVELYGSSASPIDHIAGDTLVVLAEPRALFDDCMRADDEIAAATRAAHLSPAGLFTPPRELDFGRQQRLSLSSILRAGAGAGVIAGAAAGAKSGGAGTVGIQVRQPGIAGSDAKLLGRVRQMVADGMSVAFAVPDRAAREALELSFTDEGIPLVESLATASENSVPVTSPDAATSPAPLARAMVTFFDAPIPAGIVVPSARLAVLSVSDLTVRMAKRRRARRADPTSVTFPFKPGDYVVHATHGIALFSDIVRQEVAGRERDYFLLEYAGGDKLFVPLEQVDRITRYVGPDGSSPRLTRLNTADWSRATGKARASAKRLAFDLVDLYTRRSAVSGHAFAPDTPAQQEMESSFPYEVTIDQARAIADIKADMEASKPMDRLLCGDVGFGKTEVALRAAFKCCQDARQVMVLCPTTILAQQHFETFFSRFVPFDLSVKVLSRFVTPAQQRRALEGFAKGTVDVLIGTHRLLSSDVNPHDLGLVIIDEEQRFGVQHKEQLKNMREQVDVLTLSATPIPRTMQMAMSGVRDMSLILTPPPGRLPVRVTVGEWDPDLVSEAIRAELGREGQVYYVSNRVTTIEDAVERVREAAPEARVGVAHGKMSATQAEDIMLAFSEHEIDVLVATTIIESGIDNPHTNTLIIEDSQRLGLAQLYQLKGRVGRGRTQAYAYFMFPGELPLTPEATDRLTAINEYQDLGSGMRIAMRDLEIRGAGSLMGAEQHGNLSSVGFDLFTQMLGEAVSEARGETDEVVRSEVTINLPADFYLADEYLPDVDRRVLAYRRLAAASELAEVDALQRELEDDCGALPLAGRNLFDRARVRIRAGRLGATSVSLAGGRLTYQGVEVPRAAAQRLRAHRAVVYPKTKKLSYPFRTGKEELLPVALGVLEEIGGDDEGEEG